MRREVNNIFSKTITWLTIITFVMISYVNMSALTPLASNHNQTTVHSQNEYDSSLSLVFDYITNNSSNAPSEDSSSQSIDEDSSYIDKDFFSSMRLYNKKVDRKSVV